MADFLTLNAEDVQARERQICEHLPLVRRCTGDLRVPASLREDLLQVGVIGLIYAIDHFDPSRGVGFTAYARPHIRGAMFRYLRDCVPHIRVPRRYQEICRAVHASRERLRQSLGHEPNLNTLAQALDLSVDEVRTAIHATVACSVRPLEPRDEGWPEANDDGALAEAAAVRHAVAQLDHESQRILLLTFWDGCSQQQVAERIGRSQVHVSRRLRQCLIQLRGVLAD